MVDIHSNTGRDPQRSVWEFPDIMGRMECAQRERTVFGIWPKGPCSALVNDVVYVPAKRLWRARGPLCAIDEERGEGA